MKILSITNIKCVLGNHEKYLIGGLRPPYPDGMDEAEANHHSWEHRELSCSSKKFIHQLPFMLELVRDGFKVLVMHYSMNENHDYVNYIPNPSVNDCKKMFAEYDADIIIYGHGAVFLSCFLSPL